MKRSLIIVLLLFPISLMGQTFYESDFSVGISGFSVFQEQPFGSVNLTTVIEDSNSCLRITTSQATDAEVGVSITLPSLSFRDEAHFWQVDFMVKGDLTQGSASIAVDAADGSQNRIDLIPLMDVQVGGELQLKSFVVGVPKCWPNQRDILATKAKFMVQLNQMHGSIYLGEICIKTYQMSAEVEEAWTEPSPMKYGALPWIYPAQFDNPSNQAKIIMDNVNKFNYLAGIRQMELNVFWGGGESPNSSHGTEGWDPGYNPVFEKTKGVYEFEKLDILLDELELNGFEAGVCTVLGLPSWVFTLNDYQQFVTAMVTHFKDRIHTWRPFGEVDNSMWMEEYEVYLQKFYTAAKAADPNCIVLCARVGVWLPFMLRHGMGNYMDGVTCHPFPGRGGNANQTVYRMRQYQYGLISAGLKKPVYNTQMGFGAGWTWPGPGGQRNEQIKALSIKETWSLLEEITPASYYYACVMDDRWYGLVKSFPDSYVYEPVGNHERLTPLPALYAMAEVSGSLGDNSPVAVDVTFSPNEPIAKGKIMQVTLTATNVSDISQEIMFWPFGFVENLGGIYEQVKAYDWNGMLDPGQSHSATITVMPTNKRETKGRYPVGLIVITPDSFVENAFVEKDVIVDSIAYDSLVSTSYVAESSSYCLNPEFTVSAINDLRDPVWSFDESLPILSLEGHVGTSEWIQYDFDQEFIVAGTEIYWINDSEPEYGFYLAYNKFRGPESWRVQYWDGNSWEDVNNPSGYWATLDQYDQVFFDPVATTKLRIYVQLRAGYSGGVHEWRVLSLADVCGTYWIVAPNGDVNNDCVVDIDDMTIIAENWLTDNRP